MRTAQQMLQQASLGENNFNKPEMISHEGSSMNSEFARSNSVKQPNVMDQETMMRKHGGVSEAAKASVSGVRSNDSQDLPHVA